MFVNPFLWTAFVLKTGEMMLESMRTAPGQARAARVGVIPEPAQPEEVKPRVRKKAKAAPRKRASAKAKAAAKPKVKAKPRRKRR